MNTISKIEAQAAEWLMEMWDTDMDASRWAEFDQWLNEDPQHEEVFEQMEKAVLRLKSNKRDVARKPASNRSVPAAEVRAIRPVMRSPERPFWNRRSVGVLATLSILAVGIGLTYWKSLPQTYSTPSVPGTTQRVPLSDGSIATLNSATVLKVQFTHDERDINLLRGEALFKVAHDEQRPFTVKSGGSIVRAVGTEFAVRKQEAEGERVLVVDGMVEVIPREGYARTLTAGQGASVGSGTVEVYTLTPEAMEHKLAWVNGQLVFQDEPLREVVKEFNKYHERKLIIEDPELSEVQINGNFRIWDLDSFVAGLERNGLVVAVRRNEKEIVLVRTRK